MVVFFGSGHWRGSLLACWLCVKGNVYLLSCREDIRICRTAEGKKCRLGEGGFGVVYKALMNGVDEVAVKLVKAERPSAKEMARFHKEVGL